MDDADLLDEIRRRELERKLRSIPIGVLETAYVREAQIEAVIDAVLAVSYAADATAYAHARHVGEWCARIAQSLSCAPNPQLARRVGVLSHINPSVLEEIAELRCFAPFVRDYQRSAMFESNSPRTISLIVRVADEFDARIRAEYSGRETSPSAVLDSMLAQARDANRSIVHALSIAAGLNACARVA